MPYKKSKILLTVIATSSISCASFAQEGVDVKVDDLTIDVYENNKLVSEENIYASTYYINKREYTRSRESLPSTGIMQQYTNWKKQLADDTGLSYSVDLSVLGQRGSPNGKTTAIQFQAHQAFHGRFSITNMEREQSMLRIHRQGIGIQQVARI